VKVVVSGQVKVTLADSSGDSEAKVDRKFNARVENVYTDLGGMSGRPTVCGPSVTSQDNPCPVPPQHREPGEYSSTSDRTSSGQVKECSEVRRVCTEPPPGYSQLAEDCYQSLPGDDNHLEVRAGGPNHHDYELVT